MMLQPVSLHFSGSQQARREQLRRDAMDTLRSAATLKETLKAHMPGTPEGFVGLFKYKPGDKRGPARMMASLREVQRLSQEADPTVMAHPGLSALAPILRVLSDNAAAGVRRAEATTVLTRQARRRTPEVPRSRELGRAATVLRGNGGSRRAAHKSSAS